VQKNKPGTYSVRDSYPGVKQQEVKQQEVDENNFDLLFDLLSIR